MFFYDLLLKFKYIRFLNFKQNALKFELIDIHEAKLNLVFMIYNIREDKNLNYKVIISKKLDKN